MRYGIPVLGVTAVGKELVRDARYMQPRQPHLRRAGRGVREDLLRARDFEQVAAACPVPIVIAGGKKLPEREALQMAHDAIDQGAAGVDMGRNIFQADAPVAMIQAVRKVVHEGASVKEAYQYYQDMKNKGTGATSLTRISTE